MPNKKLKIAITDAEYFSHEIESNVLSKLDAELVKFQCRTEDDVIKNCRDADALLNQYAPITRRVIENLDNTKIIARYGVGVDNVNLSAATEKGIFVTNVAYDICDVADHTIMLMLALIRKLHLAYENVKANRWDWKIFHPVDRIKGKTVGILGLGRVGKQVASRISAFDTNVVACDPYLPLDTFQKYRVTKVDFDVILKQSDILTLHAPLNDETRHMISTDQLKKMKKTAVIINAARGGVIDEKALYTALREKRIAGAALDTLEHEPINEENTLLQLDNVIITPHMAWYSVESLTEVQKKAAEEVLQCLSGKIPINLVNKEVLKIRHKG